MSALLHRERLDVEVAAVLGERSGSCVIITTTPPSGCAWLRQGSPVEEDEGVLRLLTDDELDRRPKPGAVLQSWLDTPLKDGLRSRNDVHHAVLRSRHRTLDHLRQLPFDDPTWDAPVVALPVLLDQRGTEPHRWHALLGAQDFDFDDGNVTFG